MRILRRCKRGGGAWIVMCIIDAEDHRIQSGEVIKVVIAESVTRCEIEILSGHSVNGHSSSY